MKRIHLKIYGQVHDVGFRFFIRQKAKIMGIKGFVRNDKNFVEVVAQGPDSKLHDFVRECKRGPILSRVEKVEEAEEEASEVFEDFEIRF